MSGGDITRIIQVSFPSPEKYNEEMVTNYKKLNTVYKNYIKRYPASIVTPEFDDIKRALAQTTNNHSKISADIFYNAASLEGTLEKLTSVLFQINKEIKLIRQQFLDARKKYDSLKDSSNSSEKLAEDYISTYKVRQYHNVGLVIMSLMFVYSLASS